MAGEGGKGNGGSMVSKISRIAVPVAVIVGALVYFGVVAAGDKAPDFIKPKKA